MQNKTFYYVFGGVLILTSLYIWSTGGFEIPTRHPPKTIAIDGLAHVLFGLSPFLAGVSHIILGKSEVDDSKKLVHLLLFVAILSICAALILANKSSL